MTVEKITGRHPMAEELGGYRAFPASLAAAPDPVRTALAGAHAFISTALVSDINPTTSKKAIMQRIEAALRAQGSGTFPLGSGITKSDSNNVWQAYECVRAIQGVPDEAIDLLYYEIVRLNGGSVIGGDINKMSAPDAILSLSAESGARGAVIEECAKHLENEADVATNSLHCGDNSSTIAATHRVSRAYHEAAKSIRALAIPRPQHSTPGEK